MENNFDFIRKHPVHNQYSLDRDGNVYGIHGRKLKPILNCSTKKYYRVGFQVDGKMVKFLVHRLVAETFIDNPDNLPYVNHLDLNPANNAVSNLEWCTQAHNMKHAADNGVMAWKPNRIRRTAESYTKKLTVDDVNAIQKMFSDANIKPRTWGYGKLIKATALKYNVCGVIITKVLENRYM